MKQFIDSGFEQGYYNQSRFEYIDALCGGELKAKAQAKFDSSSRQSGCGLSKKWRRLNSRVVGEVDAIQ